MSGLVTRAVDWLMRHRSSLPAWVNRLMASAARNPDGVVGRLSSVLLGGGDGAPTEVPTGGLRVFIGPTNYSGQGYRWARALEAADAGLAARNMAVSLPGGFDFPADSSVAIAVVNASSRWGEAQWEAVSQFTHVLVEAERPLFGTRFSRSVAAEVEALASAGVSVAFLAHGTDVRDPDRHAARTPWSPYPEDPRTDVLREDARANLELLRRLDRPVFVSTPDLLFDVPTAIWCPVVTDVAAFATDARVLDGGPARIIHASSAPVQKGSHLIAPALAPLLESGRAVYETVTGATADEMPARFAAADIVIDQFRIGSYGVAACEAMAAGRIVLGHVLPDVRDEVERATGLELPIVQATPDTLGDVVSGLLADPVAARELAAAGPAFVQAVHSGPFSARVLLDDWIRPRA
ncbi:hypothetical protein [Microbacterium sp. NPDC056057]|uniref:hypothetical protein n=1 Tax=Microbacterium sp. NPDC056057 TaxID=3345699 RepID=UPI0035D7CD93